MAELSISKERLNYTIDLLVTMAVEEISSFIGKDSKEVLVDFLASKTGKALYDDTTKLWWTGPSYLAEMYLEEVTAKQEVLACTATFGKKFNGKESLVDKNTQPITIRSIRENIVAKRYKQG